MTVGASEKVGYNSGEGVGEYAEVIGRSEVVVGASAKVGHNGEEGVGRSAGQSVGVR